MCIAASYEAKAFGVKTGTRVGDAKKMCPGLVLVEGRHEFYVEYHHKIVEAVERCVPISAVLSIDEMASRLMGSERGMARAVEIAQAVKAAIRRVGSTLRCSIGLAPNRYLAKIASDMQKPDGLTILRKAELPGSLEKLQLMDLPGVGRRMNERLDSQGVRSMKQVLAMSAEEMSMVWGSVYGARLWHLLRGTDYDDAAEDQKSVGHSHVLAPEMRTDATAYAVVQKLLQKAGVRLRTMRAWAGAMEVTIKYAGAPASATGLKPATADHPGSRRSGEPIARETWHERRRMLECQDTVTLVEVLQSLWARRPEAAMRRRGLVPFFVGVTLFDIVPENLHSLDLFRRH